jgi:MFS family permease
MQTFDSMDMDSTFARIRRAPLAESLAGALVLAVGMGFGRFSFTGMYPIMVKEAVMTVSAGSLAASANYAGYLLGALAMSRAGERHAARLSRLAIAGTVVCLALLAFHPSVPALVATRFIAGAMSAISLVAASVWLLHVMGHHHGAPILYAGVGAGIAISAEVVALGQAQGLGASAMWVLLGAVAAGLSALAWPKITQGAASHSEAPQRIRQTQRQPRAGMGPWTLIAIYGLAGFGYIVTATYLPLLIKTMLPHIDAVQVWAAFGLAAVPSCFIWHAVRERIGSRWAIVSNLAVQAVGVALPALTHSPAAFTGSAVLVGGTFVGTVTIVMPAAKEVAHTVKFNLMATLTAAYGVGQIAGPLLSDRLVAHTHSFDQPLFAAGAALVAGASICLARRSSV